MLSSRTKGLAQLSTGKIVGANLFVVGVVIAFIAVAMLRGLRLVTILYAFFAVFTCLRILWISGRELMQRQEAKQNDNNDHV